MTDHGLFSTEHIELFGLILLPLGSGILLLIWQTSQISLKVETMWQWFVNHGSDITGYQQGDEYKKK